MKSRRSDHLEIPILPLWTASTMDPMDGEDSQPGPEFDAMLVGAGGPPKPVRHLPTLASRGAICFVCVFSSVWVEGRGERVAQGFFWRRPIPHPRPSSPRIRRIFLRAPRTGVML